MSTLDDPSYEIGPDWCSSEDYKSYVVGLTPSKYEEVTNLLLERPNLNSTHLFRADIVSDSAKKLQTVFQRDALHPRRKDSLPPDTQSLSEKMNSHDAESDSAGPGKCADPSIEIDRSPSVDRILPPGFILYRTVVRTLIPRKPRLDRPMNQTCFIYTKAVRTPEHSTHVLVLYVPHARNEDDIPWYHPKVKFLAFQYVEQLGGGMLSVHYQLFSETQDAVPDRLHRTMLSLVQTFIRLSKLGAPSHEPVASSQLPPSARPVSAAALKDTILPQHIVQDTYTRLKQTYASDLIARWTEKTDPAKHVFEDLSIAAFLIELWRTMYEDDTFPGFVDIACGNGVLVYVLIQEGFLGHGFDARRRKTWEMLNIHENLHEQLCIPKPFLDELGEFEIKEAIGDVSAINGIFDPGVFIISNHADELTPWTPILAALSNPTNPSPFLSIPCCSHSLNGALHRYSLKDIDIAIATKVDAEVTSNHNHKADTDNNTLQPATGDLKAMRAQKQKATNHGDDKSAYACLTKKTVALAEELGFDVEMTLMRIPSTRNIGIVGNRRGQQGLEAEEVVSRIRTLVGRECTATGGEKASALAWLGRARKHVEGKGRGKVNLGKNLDTL